MCVQDKEDEPGDCNTRQWLRCSYVHDICYDVKCEYKLWDG